MWGCGPQQDLRCWPERESERGVVPGKFRKRDGGKAPYFWHASEGEEERGLTMSLQTHEKIRTLPKKLYLKELVSQTP
jgi:hypothetical protein